MSIVEWTLSASSAILHIFKGTNSVYAKTNKKCKNLQLRTNLKYTKSDRFLTSCCGCNEGKS